MIVTVAAVLFAMLVCGVGVGLGFFWVRGTINQGPPKFDRTVVLEPTQDLQDDWSVYRVPKLRLVAELPDDLEENLYAYDASHRMLLTDYFSYVGETERASVFFEGFRLRFLAAYSQKDLADEILEGYAEGTGWKTTRTDWQRSTVSSLLAARVSIEAEYEGDPFKIEALGFVVGDRMIQIIAHADAAEDASAALSRVERSLRIAPVR